MSKTPVDPNHIDKLKIWANSIREKPATKVISTSIESQDSDLHSNLPPHSYLSHPISSLSNTLSQYCSIF